MEEIIYGYARVSTREQNEDRQMIAMQQFGVAQTHIFLDKQSGKDFNRPAYRRLLNILQEGDTLVIKSIDRLGRNYEDILEQWRIITNGRRRESRRRASAAFASGRPVRNVPPTTKRAL